jgi:hypothetical protein
VKEKWRRRIHIVLDVCNHAYDAALSHLPEHNNLPVLIVRFDKKGISSQHANSGLQQEVNRKTAERHNLNGNDTPPYVVDYTTKKPVYPNPRNVFYATDVFQA